MLHNHESYSFENKSDVINLFNMFVKQDLYHNIDYNPKGYMTKVEETHATRIINDAIPYVVKEHNQLFVWSFLTN